MPSPYDDAMFVIERVREGLQQLAQRQRRNRADDYASLNPLLLRLSSLSRHYDLACRNGMAGACRRLDPRIKQQVGLLTQQLNHVGSRCNAHPNTSGQSPARNEDLPSPGMLYEELQQIEAEFGGWTVLKGQRSLFVTTERIVLDGINLGAFEIELCLYSLDTIGIEQPLRIHALEPNWAAGADDVPHPHVRDDRLCTGEASAIMTAALREGRLADYFLIVRNVLNTYNPDSPHIALEDWEGRPCDDCARSLDSDGGSWCSGCERGDYCEECMGCCEGCSTYLCFTCLSTCAFCDDSTCEHCLRRCDECEQTCCSGCLEDELCPNCFEQKELNHDHQEEQQEANPQPVSIQEGQASPQTQRPQEQAPPEPSDSPDSPALTFVRHAAQPIAPADSLAGGLGR